jgi:hypothetical protein
MVTVERTVIGTILIPTKAPKASLKLSVAVTYPETPFRSRLMRCVVATGERLSSPKQYELPSTTR